MDNPFFDCGSDEIKEAVMELVLKAAISRQGEEDGWTAIHMQKAREAVCDAAQDLLEAYEALYNPGNRINVLQENEVLEAQGNLLNNMSNSSNNNSSNNNSSNNNSSNNNSSNNNSSNNNSSNNNSKINAKKNGNQQGGKVRRRRKTQRRRKN